MGLCGSNVPNYKKHLSLGKEVIMLGKEEPLAVNLRRKLEHRPYSNKIDGKMEKWK